MPPAGGISRSVGLRGGEAHNVSNSTVLIASTKGEGGSGAVKNARTGIYFPCDYCGVNAYLI